MIQAHVEYTNGTEIYKDFSDFKEFWNWLINEGDHVEDWETYEDLEETPVL